MLWHPAISLDITGHINIKDFHTEIVMDKNQTDFSHSLIFKKKICVMNSFLIV